MQNRIGQREAATLATKKVLQSLGIDFKGTIIDSETKSLIVDDMFEQVKKGKVEFKDTESNRQRLSDDKKLRQYVNGVITNHLNSSEDFRLV